MEHVEIVYNEVDEAVSIMKEVSEWGRGQGFRVWPGDWLTREALITEDTRPENFCVGKVNGKSACAFILQWQDSEYWPSAPKYQAAYLHKFCVRREFAHRGMTRAVVAAIKEECRKRNVKFLRLDTGLDEKAVRKIYLNVGFKIVNILDYENGRSMALYELEV